MLLGFVAVQRNVPDCRCYVRASVGRLCAHATAMVEIKRVLMFVVETICNNFVMLIFVGQAIEALGLLF